AHPSSQCNTYDAKLFVILFWAAKLPSMHRIPVATCSSLLAVAVAAPSPVIPPRSTRTNNQETFNFHHACTMHHTTQNLQHLLCSQAELVGSRVLVEREHAVLDLVPPEQLIALDRP